MRRSCDAVERVTTQPTEKSSANSIALRLRWGCQRRQERKGRAMTSLATRPRRHLDVRFGLLAAAATPFGGVRFTPESCRGSR